MITALSAPESPRQPEHPTMSSREIAELCEKRHDHVLRDIEMMLQDIADPKFGVSDFVSSYIEHETRTYTVEETGQEKTKVQMLVTPRGMVRLAQIFERKGVLA